MSVSRELFVINRKPELDGEEQKRVAYLRDKLSTTESLGLEAQSASIKTDIATIERGRLITTAPLTDTELIIWRAWLPTVYTDIGDDKRHQFANYHFDRIPQSVLKLWQKHKEAGAFERFEIWTPENDQPDPILVGVNGNARHLLARWGESDANLVSFDDIKRELVRRWHKNEEIGGQPFWDAKTFHRQERTTNAIFVAILATFGSVFVSMGIAALLGLKEDVTGTVMVVLGITVAVSTFIYVRRTLTKKLWASSVLMQTIIKDDSVQRELLPASA